MTIELLEFKSGFSLSSGNFDVGDPRTITSLLHSHSDDIVVLPEGNRDLPLPNKNYSIAREVVVFEDEGVYIERSNNPKGKIIREIPIFKDNPIFVILGQGTDYSIASIYYILSYSPGKSPSI